MFAKYNGVDFDSLHAAWLPLLPNHPCLILDVGAGSGRDANALRKRGHELVAVEPAEDLRRLAEKASLPGINWLDDSLPALSAVCKLNLTFDLILVSAVWMHVAPGERSRAFRKLTNLLKPGGLLVITFRNQPFDDGRDFHATSPEELKHYAREHLLECVKEVGQADHLGRASVNWTIMVFCLPDDGTGALPVLRHVIINDAKSSTYKLALLRVLLRIADSAQGLVSQRGEGEVVIPAGLVALFWVRMFKRILLDSGQPIPQHPQKGRGMGFAGEGFNGLKNLSSFDLKLGSRFSGDAAHFLGQAIHDARKNISDMPATFTTFPNSDEPIFKVESRHQRIKPAESLTADYLSGFGDFIVPAHIWKALTNYACWIEPVVVMEWCKLMADYETDDSNRWSEMRYLNALQWLDPEHDTAEVRKIIASIKERGQSVFCVWSGQQLRSEKEWDVDHCFPFAFWPNNDLWNLMPSHPRINRGQKGKSYRLVSADTLNQSKQLILDWWNMGYWRGGLQNRFQDEAQAALPGARLFGGGDPLQAVFAGIEMQRMFLRRNQQIQEWSYS